MGLAGFTAGYLRRSPRAVSSEFIRFIRREQMQRFMGLVKKPVIRRSDLMSETRGASK
jgi:hypothetical protein